MKNLCGVGLIIIIRYLRYSQKNTKLQTSANLIVWGVLNFESIESTMVSNFTLSEVTKKKELMT